MLGISELTYDELINYIYKFMSAVTQQAEQLVTTATTTANLSITSLILSADLVGKSVIAILVIASVWSWAIIIQKYLAYSGVKKRISSFEGVFWSGQVLDELYEKIKKRTDNPLSVVFVSAMEEYKKGAIAGGQTRPDSVAIGHKERINQAMFLARNREIESLQKKLSFLAIVGSNAPFIGLFGTVWGIMHSFQSIAASKNTTLAVVAPGIAEALLATAIGLFAAIPSVIFYNYLASEVDSINNKIDDFIGELSSILSRAIDEGKM
jgi:biopolymer transport protein TolQ